MQIRGNYHDTPQHSTPCALKRDSLALMQDNAHVAGVCQKVLQDEGIDAMVGPACSSDLKPIEHIWSIMSRSIHQNHVAIQTVQELVSPGQGGDPSGDHP